MKTSVNPSLYDREYYLKYCSGYKEFKLSGGKILDVRTQKIIDSLPKISRGMKFLDIGCGRGEIVMWLAGKGASVYGIDYSKNAIAIAGRAVKKLPFGVRKRIVLKKMNAKTLRFPGDYFDGVLMLEIYEHLYSDERIKMLLEARRVMKDNGFILIHTEPNKYFINFVFRYWCYPVSTILIWVNRLFTGKTYPNLYKITDKILGEQRRLHVGEPTYFSLRRELKKVNFVSSIKSPNFIWSKPILSWKDRLYNLLVFLDPLSRFLPLSILWGQDFMVVSKK